MVNRLKKRKRIPKSETRTAGNVDRYIDVEWNENERILRKKSSHTHTHIQCSRTPATSKGDHYINNNVFAT